MKYRVYAMTDIVGSDVYDEVELDDNLTEDEIENALYEVAMQLIEWGYEKVNDDDVEDE